MVVFHPSTPAIPGAKPVIRTGTKQHKYIKLNKLWIVLNLYRWPRQECQGSHDGAQCSEEGQAVRHSFFHGRYTLSLCDLRENKFEEAPYFFAVVFFGSPFPVKYRLCSLSITVLLEQPLVQAEGRKAVGEKQDHRKKMHGPCPIYIVPYGVWLITFPPSEAR